jgi:HEAT repeat protein
LPQLNSIIKDLDKIGKKEAIERLHNLYSITDDIDSRIKILELLNELKDATHFKDIENYFLSDENSLVRIEAAKLLAFNYINQKVKAINPLIWVLENEQKQEVKYTALQLLLPLAFQQEYRETIIKSLKRALNSNDDKLKMDAVEALDIIKEESAAEDIFRILDSPNIQVRVKVIKALGNFHYQKAIPHLIYNLGLDSEYVWNYSFEALKKVVGNQILVDLLLEHLEKSKKIEDETNKIYLKRGLIKALGNLGDKKSILPLIDVLKDWHYLVYEEAIIALNKIEPKWIEKFRYELKRKSINIKP